MKLFFPSFFLDPKPPDPSYCLPVKRKHLNSYEERYEGSGIGLSMVKKAVEKMGGRVGVESEPGKGSRFWIELERAETPGAP